MASTPQLQLDHVSLATSIGSADRIQDVSFQVERGDRIAIVGPSGAGKTSLLRLINRLSEPTRGVIYFNGRDIRQLSAIALRQQITLVLQESRLLGMTVQEALAYPLTLRGMGKAAIQQRLGTWIEQLHLPSAWLDRTELQLSVGQRQLVAIARALIVQPDILLLDEPTSALDAGAADHLLNLLQRLTAEQSLTVLMVNHQLDLAQHWSTRTLYLQAGALGLDQPTAEIDWSALKTRLIEDETREAEDWME